jgi:lipopolysaccharide export system permease protein
MNIKVDNKYGIDNSKLEDIIIHKSNKNNDNSLVIKASSGELIGNEGSDILKIVLNDGYRYEEILAENPNSKEFKPQTKIYFDEHNIFIDLRELNNVDFSEEKYNNTFRMQNINQLALSIDSLEKRLVNQYENFASNFYKRTGIYNFQTNYANRSTIPNVKTTNEILNDFDKPTIDQVLNSMENNIENQITSLESQKTNFFMREKLINLHKSTLYDKYSISFTAIILFFVGAPLGAIIRKGGFGYPVVIALIMFLTYHFLGTFSKNAAEDGSIAPMLGSWISNLLMLPIGIYLISRASSDKSIINLDSKIVELKSYLKKINFKK